MRCLATRRQSSSLAALFTAERSEPVGEPVNCGLGNGRGDRRTKCVMDLTRCFNALSMHLASTTCSCVIALTIASFWNGLPER